MYFVLGIVMDSVGEKCAIPIIDIANQSYLIRSVVFAKYCV